VKRFGRKKPYSCEEMSKGTVKCLGCGKPAIHQWSCCANDHLKMPVCLDCDVALNEMALAFFRVPSRDKLIAKYKQGMRR
jgi:hypothetical protein